MKRTITLLLSLFLAFNLIAQNQDDTKGIEAACLDYLEGFYEGDTMKLARSIQPTLHKFGFMKSRSTGEFGDAYYMTFDEAKEYALGVLEKKKFPSKTAPKKVEILDQLNHIASAKVTAWWGIDYILLSKRGGKWMIEQVLWEGPLDK